MTDILLNDDGDLPRHPTLSDGPEMTVQRIKNALALFQSEWMLDDSEGLPWIRWFRSTPPPVEEMQAVIRTEIADVLGVDFVPEMEVTFDNPTGEITVEGTAVGIQGEEILVRFETEPEPEEFHPLITTNFKIFHS